MKKSLFIAWKNLLNNKLQSLLSILLIALGIGLISFVLLSKKDLVEKFEKNIKGVDLVVGAKGSPLQLILSTVFHIDDPTGNIDYDDYLKLKKNKLVKGITPLSIGDNYRGKRIIGTDKSFLDLYHLNIQSGNVFHKSGDIILGESVAKEFNLKVGQTIQSSHGFDADGHHHDNNLTIVGILEKSGLVIDDALITPYETIWALHHGISNKRQITAGLIDFRSPMSMMQLPRHINENTNMQAALPAYEKSRLIKLGAKVINRVKLIGYIIILVAALSLLTNVLSISERKKGELAYLRAIGFSRLEVATTLVSEIFMITILGVIAGLLFSRIIVGVSNQAMIPILPIKEEGVIGFLFLGLSLLISCIPIYRIYKMDVIKGLD